MSLITCIKPASERLELSVHSTNVNSGIFPCDVSEKIFMLLPSQMGVFAGLSKFWRNRIIQVLKESKAKELFFSFEFFSKYLPERIGLEFPNQKGPHSLRAQNQKKKSEAVLSINGRALLKEISSAGSVALIIQAAAKAERFLQQTLAKSLKDNEIESLLAASDNISPKTFLSRVLHPLQQVLFRNGKMAYLFPQEILSHILSYSQVETLAKVNRFWNFLSVNYYRTSKQEEIDLGVALIRKELGKEKYGDELKRISTHCRRFKQKLEALQATALIGAMFDNVKKEIAICLTTLKKADISQLKRHARTVWGKKGIDLFRLAYTYHKLVGIEEENLARSVLVDAIRSLFRMGRQTDLFEVPKLLKSDSLKNLYFLVLAEEFIKRDSLSRAFKALNLNKNKVRPWQLYDRIFTQALARGDLRLAHSAALHRSNYEHEVKDALCYLVQKHLKNDEPRKALEIAKELISDYGSSLGLTEVFDYYLSHGNILKAHKIAMIDRYLADSLLQRISEWYLSKREWDNALHYANLCIRTSAPIHAHIARQFWLAGKFDMAFEALRKERRASERNALASRIIKACLERSEFGAASQVAQLLTKDY